MKTTKLLFISIALIVFASGNLYSKDARTLYYTADSLKSAGNLQEAVNYYNKAIGADSTDPDFYRGRGHAYISMRMLEEGEADYMKALEIDPGCARCWSNISRIYAMKNDLQTALEKIRKGVELGPEDAQIYYLRAQYYQQADSNEAALADYNKAVELESGVSGYYVARAMYFLRVGNREAATKDLNKAIELDPENKFAYFNMARVHLEQNQGDKTIEMLDKALAIDSNYVDALVMLGNIYLITNRVEQSIVILSRAIELSPRNFDAYFNRSQAYAGIGEFDKSCVDKAIALKIIETTGQGKEFRGQILDEGDVMCDENVPGYYFKRGTAHMNMGQVENAIDVFTKGLEKFGDNPIMYNYRGNAFMVNEEYGMAGEDYKKADDNIANFFKYVEATPEVKSFDSAEKLLVGFIASNIASIAETKALMNKTSEAIPFIDSAITIARSSETIPSEFFLYVKGNMFFKSGDYQKAIELYNEAIDINFSFDLAYIARAIAYFNLGSGKKAEIRLLGASTNRATWVFPESNSGLEENENIASAMEDLSAVISIMTNNPEAHYVMGVISNYMGNEKSCEFIEKAIQLGWPRNDLTEKLCGSE